MDYICKYVNKGNDVVIFAATNTNDEISQYKMGRCVSSNKAIWHNFSFPIHVAYFAVHLKNEEPLYFSREHVVDKPAQTP